VTRNPRRRCKLVIITDQGKLKIVLDELYSSVINTYLYVPEKRKWKPFKVMLQK